MWFIFRHGRNWGSLCYKPWWSLHNSVDKCHMRSYNVPESSILWQWLLRQVLKRCWRWLPCNTHWLWQLGNKILCCFLTLTLLLTLCYGCIQVLFAVCTIDILNTTTIRDCSYTFTVDGWRSPPDSKLWDLPKSWLFPRQLVQWFQQSSYDLFFPWEPKWRNDRQVGIR